MTPERTKQVTDAFHKRFPPLPDSVKQAISPSTLYAIEREKGMVLLAWYEAVAWADSTRPEPNSYLEESPEQRNSRIANNKSRF